MTVKKSNTMSLFHDDADKLTRILIGSTNKSVRTCNLAANALTRALYILANNAVGGSGEGAQLTAELHDLQDANNTILSALDDSKNPLRD